MFIKKSLKSVFALALALCIAVAFAACGSGGAAPASISLEAEMALTLGEPVTLQPVYTFAEELGEEAYAQAVQAQAVSFTSSNEAVATVGPEGEVTPLAEGEAVITAAVGDMAASVHITVHPKLTGLDADEMLHVMEGDTFAIGVTPQPANALLGALVFTSSDDAVVSAKDGTLMAVGCGEAVITVASGQITAQVIVNVAHYVEGMSFDEAEGVLTVGGSVQLHPQLVPEGAEAVLAWTSSDETVATVDESGLVQAVAEGEAVIRAEVEGHGHLFAEYHLTVTAATPAGRATAGSTGSGSNAGGGNGGGGNGSNGAPPAGNGSASAPQAEGGGNGGSTGGGSGTSTPPAVDDGSNHSTVGTDCTWVFSHIGQDATCYQERVEVYNCSAPKCGLAWVKTIEGSRIPCEYTETNWQGETVCRMCWQPAHIGPPSGEEVEL